MDLSKSKSSDTDHSLRFHAPDLQTQAVENFQRTKRGGPGLTKFRNVAVKFGQAIERHTMINMMDVMIANVGGEPRHQRIGFQIAGRFECCAFKSPAFIVFENDAGEIVLRVKEIRSKRTGNAKREEQCQRQSQPSIVPAIRSIQVSLIISNGFL
jgi:hypothetical protein